MVFPQTALAIGVVDSSPNSFSYGGSYFKYRGEGSQIFWIRFGSAGRGGKLMITVHASIYILYI